MVIRWNGVSVSASESSSTAFNSLSVRVTWKDDSSLAMIDLRLGGCQLVLIRCGHRAAVACGERGQDLHRSVATGDQCPGECCDQHDEHDAPEQTPGR